MQKKVLQRVMLQAQFPWSVCLVVLSFGSLCWLVAPGRLFLYRNVIRVGSIPLMKEDNVSQRLDCGSQSLEVSGAMHTLLSAFSTSLTLDVLLSEKILDWGSCCLSSSYIFATTLDILRCESQTIGTPVFSSQNEGYWIW